MNDGYGSLGHERALSPESLGARNVRVRMDRRQNVGIRIGLRFDTE
jgi:hypothetical protein